MTPQSHRFRGTKSVLVDVDSVHKQPQIFYMLVAIEICLLAVATGGHRWTISLNLAEKMVVSAVPVAISAVSFAGLHLILKKGRCFKSLQRGFKKRQDAGDIEPGVSTATLASQAEARIVNEVHNAIVVR
jgi:hypothetical protein